MKRNFRLLLITIVILIIFTLIFLFVAHRPAKAPQDLVQTQTQQSANSSPPNFKGNEEMLKNALNLYAKKKQEGVDFANGPCLGKIADDWVLDIAHNPRQTVDDKAENQCADFRTGSAHHFVELDPNGNLITAN